jgi:hypothetical protein
MNERTPNPNQCSNPAWADIPPLSLCRAYFIPSASDFTAQCEEVKITHADGSVEYRENNPAIAEKIVVFRPDVNPDSGFEKE